MLGINTNAASLMAQKNLSSSGGTLTQSITRLSSGLRVNSAKDDAAGLAIADRMQAQIRGFDMAARNASDGISALQVADGALGKLSDNLQRMRELSVQSKNGTLNATDRANLDREYQSLSEELARIALGTDFNGNDLFSTANSQLSFQVGTGNDANDTLDIFLTANGGNGGNSLQTELGGNTTSDVANNFGNITTAADSTTAINQLDNAIDNITNMRATVGAGQSRLEQVIEFANTQSTNLSTARGRIMDADFAKETANLTRAQILQQAGTAMLSQANQLPQNVLGLLQ